MAWKVCGSTRLPLGDRGREWDESAARDRIFRWAGWEDHPNPRKAQRAFFAYNAETPRNLTSYKLPFADVVNGQLKAMPRGVFAVAQLLRGARDGVAIPEAELRSARRKATVYYHKMGEKAPWEAPGGRKTMPGKLGPAKRKKRERVARAAARTRKARGTQYHSKATMGLQARKKRIRAAQTAVRTHRVHATYRR